MKYILRLIFIAILFIASTARAQAELKMPSASFSSTLANYDKRDDTLEHVQILESYLKQYDSPLAGSAGTFVNEAKKHNLDWKLVAAISGVESYFGQQIPHASYNGWGWGVYGDNVIRFSSWDEAIITISEALRSKYINRGADDIYAIGRMYAADPAWSNKVSHFMTSIDNYEKSYTDTSLSITL